MISHNIHQISKLKLQNKSLENVYLGGETNNLLYYSDKLIKSSNYFIYTYNLEKIPSGKFTCTIWGELGEGKTRFNISGNNGYNGIGVFEKIKDGVYLFIGLWNGAITNKSISIFAQPSNITSQSIIKRIKLEEGENHNPIWSPNISETRRNLLRNSDFKNNMTYWSPGLDTTNITVDSSKLLDGRYSIKSDQSGINTETYRGLRQIISAKPGDTITISYWVYTDDLSTFLSDGRVVVEMHFRNSEHNRIKNSSLWKAMSTTNTWEQYSFTIYDAPEDTTELEILFCTYKNGRCWFNGIKAEYGYNENPVWTSNTYIYDNSNLIYSKKYIKGTFANIPEVEKESSFYYTNEESIINIPYNSVTLDFDIELDDGKNPYFYFKEEPYSVLKEIKIVQEPYNNSIANAFKNCKSLEYIDVSEYNIKHCTDISSIISWCSKLQNIDGLENWDTSKVTNMKAMFQGDVKLLKLNVNNFNTSNCIDLSWMFHSCQSIRELNVSNWDTSNCINMFALFAYMPLLQSLDLRNFNISKVTDLRAMFNYNYAMHTLDISSFDFNNGPLIDSMFYLCTNLKNLNFGYNCHTNLSLAESPLTRESALSVINGLKAVTNNKTVTFKSTTYALLSNEDIALATAKGWSVISA